jgi:hypothetical protein
MWLCVKMRHLSSVLWTREAFIPLLRLQRESSTTFGLVLATALATYFFGRQRDSKILGCCLHCGTRQQLNVARTAFARG